MHGTDPADDDIHGEPRAEDAEHLHEGHLMSQQPPSGEVIVYQAPDGEVRVDVRLERETVWLSLIRMTELFGRDKSVVSRHLRNVFASGELGRACRQRPLGLSLRPRRSPWMPHGSS